VDGLKRPVTVAFISRPVQKVIVLCSHKLKRFPFPIVFCRLLEIFLLEGSCGPGGGGQGCGAFGVRGDVHHGHGEQVGVDGGLAAL
jgi:hypothetical protein